MPLRVEGPTRTDMKPKPWRVNPRLVHPEWRWAWEGGGLPLWEGGGDPHIFPHSPIIKGSAYSADWTKTQWGPGFTFSDVGGQHFSFDVQDRFIGSGPFTFVLACRPGFGSGDETKGACGTTDGNSDGVRFLFVSGGSFRHRLLTSTGAVNVDVSTSHSTDDRVVWVGRWDGSTVYCDTLNHTTNERQQATASLGGTLSHENALSFGAISTGSTTGWEGEIVGWWSSPQFTSNVEELLHFPFGPFRRQTIRYVGGPTAAGQTFTVSLAEAVVARDTLEDTATLTVEVADVASAQSTETETLTMRETVSEVGVAADQLTDAQVMVEVLSEATRANDQMVGTLGRVFAAVLTESVSATDTVESRMTAVETIAETVRAADQLNITATLRETLAESAVAAETVTAPVAGVITATLKESVSAGDSLETTMTMTAQVREAVRALDRLGLTQTLVTQVIEQAAASDQLQSTLPAEALRFIFDAVRGNQDFDAVDGDTFDAQGSNDFDASGAD